jgi:signal peptidase I
MAGPEVEAQQAPEEQVPAATQASPAPGTGRERARQGLALVRELLQTLVLTGVLFLAARATVQPFRVDGHSMDPTLHDGEYILVDKISDRVGHVQRGDIVVFEYPGDTTRDFVKRVIGLPGDTVAVRDGKVFVNGVALSEPYLPPDPPNWRQECNAARGPLWGSVHRPCYTMAPDKVPAGSLFVLGDNRNNSFDSHSWGLLPERLLIGRARLAYWPPANAALFIDPSYARGT